MKMIRVISKKGGNSGDITVQISIKDDIIVSIEIIEQDEDEPYFTDALSVIDSIIETNGC